MKIYYVPNGGLRIEMDTKRDYTLPVPICDSKELAALDKLTKRYEDLTEPGIVSKAADAAGKLLPGPVKRLLPQIGKNITEQELYRQIMAIAGSGFGTLMELAAKSALSEKDILEKINKKGTYQFSSLEEICLARSYDLANVADSLKRRNVVAAAFEGGATGAVGLAGLPFNLALSTFLYFRAVQSIAMCYGYDVKGDSGEMEIASSVFMGGLSPDSNVQNNELSYALSKIMVMGKTDFLKQAASKGWQHMAKQDGVALVLTQIRALASKVAQKALEKAGKQNVLENSIFRDILTQIGKKMTQKNISKAMPVISSLFGALCDAAQMKNVLEYADIFYQKRFIAEKEERIGILTEKAAVVTIEGQLVE